MLLLCPQLTRGQRSSGVAIFIELTGCEEVGETNLDFGAPFHLTYASIALFCCTKSFIYWAASPHLWKSNLGRLQPHGKTLLQCGETRLCAVMY